MKKLIYLLIMTVVVNGCVATTARTNKLSLGMSKEDAIRAMGNPTSVKAKDSEEVLEYILYPTWTPSIYDKSQQFWIILRDGKVVQYGNAGDFNSAMPEDGE
ncbi:MAG: hypothetical protein WCI77_06575 [Candidatus Omnitrophota bacterium]